MAPTNHPSLIALSREHHTALVMSARIVGLTGNLTAQSEMCEFLFERHSTEFEAHIEDEENRIFPPLLGTHEKLVLRALEDHAVLRKLVRRIAACDCAALMWFGEKLVEHVRFEERELFPLYEALIGDN